MKTSFTTKVTRFPKGYGCRILRDGVPIVEALASSRDMIGPTFRDLFRTLDKMGGDAYTSAVRKRKYKEGNWCAQVKHKWLGNTKIG